MLLNLGVWINGLFIDPGDGMDLVLAVPLIFLGAVSLLGWYKHSRTPLPSSQQQWKFTLRALLLNYVILYGLYMTPYILNGDHIDFLGWPGIQFPIVLGLFIAGCVLSWKYELYAGILFIIWYGVVLYGTLAYFEIQNSGPHVLFGLVILLQGAFYLNYHFRIKPR
jgi:hypothetical protein